MGAGDAASAYRIVPYQPAHHRGAVVELQRHLWSDDAGRNAAYLDWKYHRNPFIVEPLIWLAYSGDELVAMRGAFGSCWEAEGSGPVTLPYTDDLVILPAHRGRWLHQRIMATAMADLAARGYPYAVNLSASRQTAAASLRMKWRSAGSVGSMLRRSSAERVSSLVRGRTQRMPGLWRLTALLNRMSSMTDGEALFRRFEKLATARGLTVSATPRSSAMATLVNRLPWDGRIRHVRDAAWLDWRYRNPLHEYRFAYAGGEALEGYIALRHIHGQRRVSIVDLEAGDDATRRVLLAAAADGGFAELHAWAATLDPRGGARLTTLGFSPEGGGFETAVLVRATAGEQASAEWHLGDRPLADISAWDLRMIYSAMG